MLGVTGGACCGLRCVRRFVFGPARLKCSRKSGRVSTKRIVYFRGRAQLRVAQWSRADRVEVRFRGSKGDQLRKGVVISRVRAGSPRPVGAGGGAVDLMLELMSCYFFLPSSASLVAYGSVGGRWSL